MREPVQSRTETGFGRVHLLDVVDEVAVGDAQAGRLADASRPAPRATAARASPVCASAGSARGERDQPGSQPVPRVARDLFHDTFAGERREQAGRRGLGSSARSATSVTPIGPSASAPRTAKARSMDWTLDIGPLLG